MIVRFSISNYLSFEYTEKDLPCIDMTASKPRNKIDHILELEKEELLKASVMFGGNGSGKSNIIKGLRFIKRIVTTDWMPTPNSGLYCKNTPENKSKPIRFRIEFVKEHDPKDLSDIMDWYINRSRGVSKVIENPFNDRYVHYEYELELQYVADDLPYNISKESCHIIDSGKRSNFGFDYENDLLEKKIELSEDDSEIYGLVSAMQFLRSKLTETICQKKILELDLKDVNDKINSADKTAEEINGEIMIDNVSFEKSRFDAIIMQKRGLLSERKRLEHEVERLSKDEADLQNMILSRENDLENRRTKKRRQTILDRIKTIPAVRGQSSRKLEYSDLKEWMEACYRHDVRDWFANTLVLVDIGDKVLPIKGFEELDRINAVLPLFDAHIKGLTSIEVTDSKELKDMVDNIDESELRPFFDYAKLNSGTGLPYTKVVSDGINFYELNFRHSILSVKKLMTEHNDGSIHELFEESDGTRRLVELATVLIEPKINKVYVIDELDRRLHPLITTNFISIFYNLDSQRMQLIITTHETRLATTNIFRQDEINLVDHDDRGTKVTRAKDAIKTYNKPFEELYLDDLLLGGVPRIKSLQ